MGTIRSYNSTMKTLLVIVLSLLNSSYSKPQLFEFLERVADGVAGARSLGEGRAGGLLDNIRNNIRNNPLLQERILGNRLNPCEGESPDVCRCSDGQEFQFSIDYNSNPCTGAGAVPDLCTCPSGRTFRPQKVAQKAAAQFDIPTCGSGQVPASCTCQDGTSSIAGGARPCDGRIPRSCTCPDGKVIRANEVISKIIPAIQEILG